LPQYPAPNEVTFGAVIRGFSKLKDFNMVEQIFLEMRKLGLVASSNDWRFVIETFARTNQLDKAFILVDQMRSENVRVQGILLNILLRQCQKRNRLSLFTKRFGVRATIPTEYSDQQRKKQFKGGQRLEKGTSAQQQQQGENASIIAKGKKFIDLAIDEYAKQLEVQQADFNTNWDVESQQFSVLSESKTQSSEQDKELEDYIQNLETKLIDHDKLLPQVQQSMQQNRRKLHDLQKKKANINQPTKEIKGHSKTKTKPGTVEKNQKPRATFKFHVQ